LTQTAGGLTRLPA